MINVETEYFSLNKILLLAVGLWPYQQSNLTRFQFIFLSSILTTNVIFQVKDLLEQLLHACNELKEGNEIAIINEYGYNGKRYTTALIVLAVCSLFIIIVVSFCSDIFNIILPTNVSRSHHLLTITEYFIDQEKYFYFILLHSIASICIGATVMLAIGAMLITYLQHTCGMFKIASYRIERAMSINMLQNINQENILIFNGLICAVNIHRQAMRLSKHLLSSFEAMMFCLIIFGVLSVSLNLFRVALLICDKTLY
ncbi:unnamed protein product [Lasius platythorax]|uniref:Uncharacterized protein n=1 Tax=Lasius platythorax TaxID=488582 RepID=A0AAV2NPH7_9HYME